MIDVAHPLIIRISCFVLLVTNLLWPHYLFFGLGSIGVNPFTLGIIFGLILCAIYFIGTPRYLNAILLMVSKNAMVFVAYFFVVMSMIVAACFSLNVGASLQSVLRSMYVFLPFLLCSFYFLDPRLRASLLPTILVCAVIQMVLALIEHATSSSIAGAFQLDKLGVGDAGALAQVVTDRTRDGSYRAQALFSHPIVLGQFSAACLSLIVLLLFRRSLVSKLISVVLIPTAILAVLASGTRSALTLSVISGAMIFALGVRRQRLGLIGTVMRVYLLVCFAIAAVTLGGDTLEQLVNGRTTMEKQSTQVRVTQLDYGAAAVLQKPLFGYGPGQGAPYAGIVNGFGQATVDNYFLSVALDTGLVGLGAWMLFITTFLGTGLRGISRSVGLEREQAMGFFALAFALFFGELVQSISDLIALQMIILAWFITAPATNNTQDF